MHKIFRYPKFSETFRACPRIFLALWDQKFSTEKRDTPFFIHIFFEIKNFLKNSRISLRKFSALWDIKFSTGNRDMPPLIHKFFSIPENFRKTEGFLYKAFRFGPVRQKVPTKPWCPPPMHENFRWKNFSEAPKCSPMKYFNTVRQKPTENRDSPPPYPNFFDTRNYCNSKGFLYKNFRHWDKKFSTENLDTPPPPSFIQIFSGPEVSETLKDSPTKFFGTVRQKNFDRKSWKSPPPLLSINFFATGRFLKHSTEGFTYQIYRHCETKNFRRKNVIPPSMHKIFRYPKFSETLKVCSRNFSALWDKKFSTEKRDTP